ncbi:acyl-coenzyme A thioesterase 8-like [Patella vulgata]|uniref:acyl-coenzyme A thioesterase 8-like n=1 Tax=Patella vulgata TaxID=6465 RepID=UPI00218025DB|nr:acyl-coenzyme A thioesterase 8-like [Patella vulgata]
MSNRVNIGSFLMDPESDNVLLNKHLNLEKVEKNLYRSTYQQMNVGGRNVFGGQVIGLGLIAAGDTVEPGYHLHSLHCYFLRGGLDQPILYQVEATREGSTYCSRSVKAIQNGLTLFTMQCSFKKQESDSFEHQFKMPDVPKPDELKDRSQLYKDWIDETDPSDENLHGLLRRYKMRAETDTYEVRPVDPQRFRRDKGGEPRECLWIRAKLPLGDDAHLNKCVAAYYSDMHLAGISSYPKARIPGTFQFFVTSLDHSVWFHHPFRIDDWVLYEMESPHAANGRGFGVGRFWSPDGKLVMSVAQESVLRTLKAKL